MSLSPADIAALLDANGLFEKTIMLERGDFLKKAGSTDTHIYYIEEGTVYAYIVDGEEERIVRFGYKGNIIVSLDSFLTESPSEFYIQAIKKCRVKIVTKNSFTRFIAQNEKGAALWTKMLENLVIQQIEREKDLLIQSPRERYERVLKRSPQLFQEVANKYIAAYLRMSPETLSRLKKR
ncbi:Crp/Fnr family transcriptional regulator [Niabella sp. 22666]|uniref:Crp/Fnr family transcriptional regulator n=1 Tax=Niabella sp. 22666 TaxID=3453954 RepID=UPI003F864A4C